MTEDTRANMTHSLKDLAYILEHIGSLALSTKQAVDIIAAKLNEDQ